MSSTSKRLLAAVLCVLMTLGLFVPAGAAPATLGGEYAVVEVPLGDDNAIAAQPAAAGDIVTAAERPVSAARDQDEPAVLLDAVCSENTPHAAGSVIKVSATSNEHWIAGQENGGFVLSAETTSASFATPSPKKAFSAGGKMTYNSAYEKQYKMTGVLGDETIEVTDKAAGNAKYTVTIHVIDPSAVPPCEHTAGWEVRSTTATCTAAGKTTEACKTCGETREVDQAALGHDLKDVPAVAATCGKDGVAAGKKCSRCDYTTGGQVVPATGAHTFSGDTCSVCGYEQHTAHTYVEVSNTATCTAAGVKTEQCSKTGCTEKKTTNVAALGHNEDGVVEHEDPTCTRPGVVGGKYCTRCGNGDAAAEAAIPALGHNYDASGNCTRCDATKTAFTLEGGDFEVAYAQWSLEAGVTSYKVYVAPKGGAYTQIDENLVREYPGYMRADAMGLKAGTYTLKVVPYKGAAEQTAMVTNEIEVRAHDRSGYAFAGKQTPGAYNMDGTLKTGAIVVYVTDKNKDTVTAKVNVEGKGDVELTGLQNIIDGWKKGKETRALDVRIIGNVTDPSVLLGGDIVIENKNSMGAITIEGVGNDAVINGFGIRIKNADYVEISNLAFMNTDADEGDNIGVQQGANYFWAHNNDLFYGGPGGDSDQAKGDGALDFKNSYYGTFSYNHFWDTGKSCLGGMKNDQNYMTYHHNWFDHSDSRHPRLRKATSVHIYNNYFDGNSKYGVGAALSSNAFVDSNYFRNTKYPMLSSMQGSDIGSKEGNVRGDGKGTFSSENGGIIKAYGNIIVGANNFIPYSAANNVEFDAYVVNSRDESVPATVKAYQGGQTYQNADKQLYIDANYPIENAANCVPTVTQWAGRVQGGDLQYEFDDAVEDSNYGVIQELKSTLLSYQPTVISAGGTVTQSTSGEVSHTHTPGVWTVTKTPGCNASTQELVDGLETQTCTTCGEVLGTRKLAGQHSNDGSGTCTVCGYATGNGGGAVASGSSKTLKYSSFKTTADKVAITDDEMAGIEDGYFKVFGTVNKRVKSDTTTNMTSLQMAKNGGSGFEFTVESAPATVTVEFSGVDSAKASFIVLKTKDGGTVMKTKDGAEYPKSSKSSDMVTVTYSLEEGQEGTYQLTSYQGDANNMDARIYLLSVTETDPDDGDDDIQETVSLTQRLTNLASSTSATRVVEGQALTITLRVTDTSKYDLPDTVTVTVGGDALETVNYNKTTGVISLTADQVSASIVITAAAKAKDTTTPEVVDTTGLEAAITAAEKLTAVKVDTDAANVDKDTSWVTKSVMDALKSAIATAKALDTTKADQTAVDAAAKALNDAVDTFMAAVQEGTKETGGSGTATVHTFESKTLTVTAKGSCVAGAYAGDSYFTLAPTSATKYDESSKQWTAEAFGDNAYDPAGDNAASKVVRFNMGGKSTKDGPGVKFTTTADNAKVQIWWVQGGGDTEDKDASGNKLGTFSDADIRQIAVLKAGDASKVAASELAHTSSTPSGTDAGRVKANDPEYTELTIPTAGEYMVGSLEGSNYIFKIVVTEGASGGTTTPTVDKSALTKAIDDATAAIAVPTVSKDGKDVEPTAKWVTQAEKDTFQAAINAAKAAKLTAASAADVTAAVDTLKAAAAAFEAAQENGTKGEATTNPVTKITISGSGTVTVGNTITLTATVKPDDATNKAVTWTSSNEKVATVDANGKVTGVASGTATITATAKDGSGVKDTWNVSVSTTSSPSSSPSGGGGSKKPSGGDEPTTPPAMGFVDVKSGDRFYDAVEKAFSKGLMKGTDDTHFAPDATTTRAMVMTILARLNGKDTEGGETWYAKGMAWAVEAGVSDGTAPLSQVTREQLAVMLFRYANPKVLDKSDALGQFSDAASVSDWAVEALQWAVKVGILNGKGNGILDPQGPATRSQVCAMMIRFVELDK